MVSQTTISGLPDMTDASTPAHLIQHNEGHICEPVFSTLIQRHAIQLPHFVHHVTKDFCGHDHDVCLHNDWFRGLKHKPDTCQNCH